MVTPSAERPRNVEDLHLDRVVASQPEIGPTPPDGGYGWLIVASAAVYHITVPGLFTLYGLVILKAIREQDHEVGEKIKIWQVDIALVPVIMVVMKLLLESWCRTVVKLFNMPRFMALSGLCMTVAGVLLSSFSTTTDDNDHIVSVFAGIFAGSGCALTGQQADVIITHYFRDRLTTAQRIVRMAPSLGNCLIPLLVGTLCSRYAADAVVTVYAAILMQNCFFLASFSRPIYIEKVIRSTYNMLRDAVEDEDEVVFSNEERPESSRQTNVDVQPGRSQQDENDDSIVVFKSNKNAKEILSPEVASREEITDNRRFSSDFSSMAYETSNRNSNRFSSDFGNFDATQYNRVSGYQELENIDRENQNPQPLYRETTVDAPVEQSLAYAINPDMTAGTARRTASVKKNLITLANMLRDLNFYLYILLHLCTTYSILILGLVLPLIIWEKNPSLNVWGVATLVALAHGTAICFIMMCVVLPKSINEKAKLCAMFCLTGALGFYGISITSNKSFLVVWAMMASFSSASASILQQPLYNNFINEFDTTATTAVANTVVAAFVMLWAVVHDYEYGTCFVIASVLQMVTGGVFLASSFRRQRR
ncbi:hypothetical protein JYU34_017323 [Plutella xylostella]|uniref:Uncharacterized protein n=1 Tax=Plutella xylostella TaxID=51655 RepID=A0ABQ7Q4P5_PLUXY|nr:hypothetical protein JYU34_017323 [Plutella xylostella]